MTQLDSNERLHAMRAIFEATDGNINPTAAETAFTWMRKLHLLGDGETIEPLTPAEGEALCRVLEGYANRSSSRGHSFGIAVTIAFKIGLATEGKAWPVLRENEP